MHAGALGAARFPEFGGDHELAHALDRELQCMHFRQFFMRHRVPAPRRGGRPEIGTQPRRLPTQDIRDWVDGVRHTSLEAALVAIDDYLLEQEKRSRHAHPPQNRRIRGGSIARLHHRDRNIRRREHQIKITG